MNQTISFLSDFGHDDEFVGVVHGVIARIAPTVRVIDINHGVSRGNIPEGALSLTRAVQFMPDGVFLAVVDPGVGTSRLAIAARTPVGYFVGPDNGVLAPAVAMVGGADLIVSLEDERFQLPQQGSTFHGRDIFGPAAAVLASGQAEIEDLGPTVDPETITPLLIPLAEFTERGSIKGSVLWIDTYGNVQVNIAPEDLRTLGLSLGDEVLVGAGMDEFPITWGESYGSVEEGEGVLHVDSHGQMALGVRSGSAADEYGLAVGDPIVLGRPEGGRRLNLAVTAL